MALNKPVTFSIATGYKGNRSEVSCCDDMIMSDVYEAAGIPTTADATGMLVGGGTRKLGVGDIINANEYKSISFSQGSSSAA